MNDFNFVAPFYDSLSRLVFGRSLIQAQCHFLTEIEEKDNVLVIGGGTGKILEALECNEVVYLEKSSRMINRAQRRRGKAIVTFIDKDVLAYQPDRSFDAIICPFVLDCFEARNLVRVLEFCKEHLKPVGRLIVTDFREKRSNRFLIRLMYGFFRLSSRIEASSLPDIECQALDAGFSMVKSFEFREGTVFSTIFSLPRTARR